MKLEPEQKKQRVAVLLGDLDDIFRDISWLNDMIKGTVGLANQHYSNEKRKSEIKLQKIKDELTRLRASN